MKKPLILLITILLNSFVYGQVPKTKLGELTGIVLENTKEEELPYASVVLKDANLKIIEGVITNEKGEFIIKDIPEGSYTLEIQYNGFESYTTSVTINTTNMKMDLGKILLKEDATVLKEVVVVGETSQVSLRLDKKVFRVGKDVLSQSGSATDVLGNVPSVSVSPSGGISLRGNSNVNILINGRRSGLSQVQALEQIPSDNIDRVEIITNPSARYDAAGSAGIINIILKKNRREGFSGQVRAVTGTPTDYRLIGNVNYKTEKINLFSNIGFRYTDYVGNYTKEQTTTNNGTEVFLDQNEDQDRHDDGRLFYFGADYYINDKNTFTTAFYRNETRDEDESRFGYDFSSTGIRDSTLRTIANSNEKRNYNQLEANYTKTYDEEGAKKLTMDLQYDFYNSNKGWRILTDRSFPTTENIFNLRTNSLNKNRDIAVESNFVTPFGKSSSFESGVKFENRRVINGFEAEEFVNGSFQTLEEFDNELEYNERILSGYAQYGNKIEKFSYLLGLRMEYTKVRIEDVEGSFNETFDYNRLFPTVNLGYTFSENTTAQLNYSKRINRPFLWQLNPFFELTDFNSRFFGNPELLPSFSDAVEVTLLQKGGKFTLNPSIYFSRTTDNIQYATEQNDENIFVTTLFNLDSEERYGFELSASYKPLKWITFNGEFNAYRFEQKGDFNNRSFDFKDGTWYSSLNTRIKLGSSFTFQSRYGYEAQRNNAQTRTQPISYLNAGISKDLFKNNGTLALNVSNVFNTRKARETVVGQNFLLNQVFNPNRARWTLSFVYKFNNEGGKENRQAKRSNRN